MYAPHVGLAHARPAAPASHPAALAPDAPFGLPFVPIPADGPGFVEAPTLGVVAAITRIPPEAATLAIAVALLTGYVGQRLLRERPWSVSQSRTWFGIGLGIVALAAVAIAIGGWLGAPAYAFAFGVNVAAVGAGVAFLAALLRMPGPAATRRVRLRRALDGAIVGLCLMFCGRILVVSPYPHLDSPAFWLIMFHCCVLATAVLAGVRPRAGRRAPVLCATGVGLATAGLSGFAYALAHGAPTALIVALLALQLAAPLLIWWGASALAVSSPAMVPRAPLIAVPTGLALVVALYQLLTGGEVDRGAMMIGTLAALAVGVRHVIVVRALTSTDEIGAGDGLVSTIRRADGRNAEPSGQWADVLGAEGDAKDSAFEPWRRCGETQGVGQTMRRAIDAMRSGPRPSGALLVIGIDAPEAEAATREDALREVAKRVRDLTSPERGDRTAEADPPTRLTATEFALLTPASLAQAYGLAERLVIGLAEPVAVGRDTLRLTACAGLTDIAGAAGAGDAIQRARLALSRARQLGPGRVEWYDGEVAAAVARRSTLERDLPEAVRRGELDLIYQPIMDLEQGRPLAVEALLRWRHPRLGTLLPADVIPVAEATGAMGDVGHWVLRRATAQLAAWRTEGRDLSMAINVSPCQLGAAAFRSDVAAVLAAHALPPERLVLEVAESGIEKGAGLDESVGALRSVGVRTALDEFGAGVSSLAHLRTLPIDMVKIGQPLVAAGTSPSLIGVMVGVGRRLGIEVVAQGVEAPAQLAAVRDVGCRLGQGHLFARPQPAERTEAYLDGFGVR